MSPAQPLPSIPLVAGVSFFIYKNDHLEQLTWSVTFTSISCIDMDVNSNFLKEEKTKLACAVPLKHLPASVQYMSTSQTFVIR